MEDEDGLIPPMQEEHLRGMAVRMEQEADALRRHFFDRVAQLWWLPVLGISAAVVCAREAGCCVRHITVQGFSWREFGSVLFHGTVAAGLGIAALVELGRWARFVHLERKALRFARTMHKDLEEALLRQHLLPDPQEERAQETDKGLH